MDLHLFSVVFLGAVGAVGAFDARTRRVGVLMLVVALVALAMEAFAEDTCANHPRGYWTVDDSGSSGEEGQHTADENGDVQVWRDNVPVGTDSQVMSLHTDPASWSPECPSAHVGVFYSIGIGPGYGVPQAAVWAGSFSDNCTGVFEPPCRKEGSQGFDVGPAQEFQIGMWVNGAAKGFAAVEVRSQFVTVPPRLSHTTKRRAEKVANAMDNYVTAAAAGGLAAKVLNRVGIFKVLGVTGSAAAGISTGIRKALKFDPWDATRTVYVSRQIAMPAGIPAKYKPWVRNGLEMQRWWQGVVVALNRVNTSVALKDAVNEDRQQGAIDRYVTKLGLLMAREAQFRTKLAPDFAPFDVDLLAAVPDLRAAAAVMP